MFWFCEPLADVEVSLLVCMFNSIFVSLGTCVKQMAEKVKLQTFPSYVQPEDWETGRN